MSQAIDLENILARHDKWLRVEPGGSRARFEGMDLRGFDFSGRDLSQAVMLSCDLSGCNMSGSE